MKILLVNDLLQGGGVEKLMYDIVMRYHNEYQMAILTDQKDSEFESIYPDNVQYFYQMEKPYPRAKNYIHKKKIQYQKKVNEAKLLKKIQSENFDVMLCMKEGWIMMMALQYGGDIPHRVAWVHTDYSKSYYTKYWYGSAENEIRYMKRFQHIVCVSQVIKDSIETVIGNPQNLIVRYNPVNKAEILKKAEAEIADIHRNERPLFVSVGRLNIQKGYDVLLEVCNLLNAEGYHYDVWIVGGGESSNHYEVLHDLENKIKAYHLNNVYLLGAKDNPYPYVKKADWFLSTSRYEGYSYVSQEAAILGKALLLTDCSGVMELLKSDENGIIMENSYKGIFYGMKKVLDKPELARQYSNRVEVFDDDFYYADRMQQIQELFTI